ncbi:MAG: hypothetical protein FJ109_11570 [Deltaproteobacteria bacterium]|nr:hypothetical protein [Deltaproteobacteria bacterium]
MARQTMRKVRKAFGVDEFGQLLLPRKVGNVRLSRLEHVDDVGGCPYCFPHGIEATNSTFRKNARSWKKRRRTRYRQRRK